MKASSLIVTKNVSDKIKSKFYWLRGKQFLDDTLYFCWKISVLDVVINYWIPHKIRCNQYHMLEEITFSIKATTQ